MSELRKLRTFIDEMDNKGLARSGITIGKRAQEYGREERVRDSRIQYSFSVDSNRLADISFSAKSKPPKNSFIKSRIGIWWWSDPGEKARDTYAINIDNKINSAIRKGLVEYDSDDVNNPIIIPGKTQSILDDIGQYNRDVYSNVKSFMSRKIRCALGSYITDTIFKDYLTIDEIMQQVSNMNFKFSAEAQITPESLISQLESLSVIRRVEDKFIPFYAYEIFGENTQTILQDNIYDSHLDVVKNMIMKMPGISRSTLFRQLPGDAKRPVIQKALEEMANKKLIYTIKTQNTLFKDFNRGEESLIYIPTWFLHFIMDRKPDLVQTEAFLLSLLSLSWFWDSMKHPLENFDDELDNLTQFLSSICNGSIKWREIISLGTPTLHFAWTMKTAGILHDVKEEMEETFCLPQSIPVIRALNDALNQSYDTEIWFGGLRRSTDLSTVITEISTVQQEVDSYIVDKWRPATLTNSLPEFK